jgi:hypothetical protein
LKKYSFSKIQTEKRVSLKKNKKELRKKIGKGGISNSLIILDERQNQF